MPEIKLKDAVNLIYQIIDQRRRRGRPTPFFFVGGAGISSPPLKLAREIEQDCRTEANRYGEVVDPPSSSPMNSYSYWLTRAYPSPEELQSYLRGLMENKPISKANLRLAHLLLDRKVATTVFTPNFDDLLSKALSLFSEPHLVCDHPLTTGRINVQDKDIQIVHVHGSYWFYDCCNRDNEITERSRDAAMSALLDKWLHEHSPLIVGYSGWDGDIIMNALKKRLSAGKLGTPLFWFCYSRNSLSRLPDWLTKGSQESDIYFVVPEDLTSLVPRPDIRSGAVESQDVALDGSGIVEPNDTPDRARDSALSASSVFDALIKRFSLQTPSLTERPLDFYAKGLRTQLGSPESEDGQLDIYSFHKVISRIEKAAKLLEESETQGAPDPLQKIRAAISRADHRHVIMSANEINFNLLSKKDLKEAVSILWEASRGLNDDSVEEIQGYDLIAGLSNRLTGDSVVQDRAANALTYKGITLRVLGRSEEAIASYDEVIRRFGAAEGLNLREWVAKALLDKGVVLGNLGRNEEAISTYNEMVRRFGDARELTFEERVAKAIVNKGVRLGVIGRFDDEITAYDEVLRRFGARSETSLQVQVSIALLNKGVRIGATGSTDKEIALYDDLVSRFDDSKDVIIRENVAKSLIFKGITFGVLGKNEDAVKAYDDVIRRFAEDAESSLQIQVAISLVNKGVRLGELGRNEEEIAAYDEVISRFSASGELALMQRVARALFNKAVRFGGLNRVEDELSLYDEVVGRFGESSDATLRGQVAIALVNKGVRFGKLGRSEEEIGVYDDVSQRFSDVSEVDTLKQVARSLVYKGITFTDLDKNEEAIGVYDEVIHRFSQAPDLAIREWVVVALLNKGNALRKLDQHDKAIGIYNDLLNQFGEATEETLLLLIAKALFYRGSLFEADGEIEMALNSFRELVHRFEETSTPDIRWYVDRSKERIQQLTTTTETPSSDNAT